MTTVQEMVKNNIKDFSEVRNYINEEKKPSKKYLIVIGNDKEEKDFRIDCETDNLDDIVAIYLDMINTYYYNFYYYGVFINSEVN